MNIKQTAKGTDTENAPMEIFIDSDGIVLKKYRTSEELLNVVSVLLEAFDNPVDDLEEEKYLQ